MKRIKMHQRVWAGLVACLLVSGWCQANVDPSRPASAVVQGVEGVVQVVDARGLTRLAVLGSKLEGGDTLITGSDSTADLLLPETRATIGLGPSSRLRIEELSYRDDAGGRLTRSLLDLQAGEMLGRVDKLGLGSQFEVKMPNGVASVRGTLFFIDLKQFAVHVVHGLVHVTVSVDLGDGFGQSTTVEVDDGQSLFIPKSWQASGQNASLDQLAAVRTPFAKQPNLLQWFAKHESRFVEFEGAGNRITLNFKGRRAGMSHVWILRPPTVDDVSFY